MKKESAYSMPKQCPNAVSSSLSDPTVVVESPTTGFTKDSSIEIARESGGASANLKTQMWIERIMMVASLQSDEQGWHGAQSVLVGLLL